MHILHDVKLEPLFMPYIVLYFYTHMQLCSSSDSFHVVLNNNIATILNLFNIVTFLELPIVENAKR